MKANESASTWYAVYTRHQHEKTVERVLANRGFETLLPLYQTTHRWKDRRKLLSLPLFPCYVFLHGGLDRRLDIVTTPGVFALVSQAGQPAAIPAAEIDAVRRAVESGFPVEPHALLQCGSWVRVRCGPLEGVKGILVRKKNSYRLILAVEMLGKAVAVEVDSCEVEALHGRSPGKRELGYSPSFKLLPRTPLSGCEDWA